MRQLEDLCVWLVSAKSQRDSERDRGLDESGIKGFTDKNCFDCDGYNKDCLSHSNLKMEIKINEY